MAGNRMCKTPVIVSNDRTVKRLKRIPLNERVFQEEWLQEVLEKQPSILPSGDIDSVYARLLCVAREVEVPSGFIDNLYISAQGYVVIVETKLWKNPEAVRTVVGQIIDYAKDVCTWNYEKLDSVFRAYHKGQTLFSAMLEHRYQDAEDEAYFIDIVEKNLHSARFLLMIAGDGIREGTEKMAAFLNENSAMRFDLALCELEVYDLGNGERLIVPQLTAKTKLIERTVFRVGDSIQFDLDHDQTEGTAVSKLKPRKLLDKEDWAKSTPLRGITQEEILEFIDELLALQYQYHVGTKDLCIDLYINRQRLGCLMLFGGGEVAAFQPSAYYDFLDKLGYSTASAERLFEELRPHLADYQTNTPYEKANGYYYIDMRSFSEHKEKLLLAFEKFRLSFRE